MKRKKQIYDYKAFNEMLDFIEKFSIVLYGKEYEDRDKKTQSLTCYSWCIFKPKNVIVTTRYAKDNFDKPCTYYFTRDDTNVHLKAGSEEYAVFKKAAGEYIPDFANDEYSIEHIGKHEGKFNNTQGGIKIYNPKYNGIKDLHVYQYDLNSAYLSIIYNNWLDTRKPMYDHVLQPGEHGFIINDDLTLFTKPGARVDIAFPVIETPKCIKEYADRWFKRKSQKEDQFLKLNAKHQIIDSVGYLQYHNPYLRAWIVELCNKQMMDYVNMYKEDWVLVNTDAIYLTKPSDILSSLTGTNIGQFKLEEGNITLSGNNYESKEFGDKQSGKQKYNFYEVINNRLVRIDEKENG